MGRASKVKIQMLRAKVLRKLFDAGYMVKEVYYTDLLTDNRNTVMKGLGSTLLFPTPFSGSVYFIQLRFCKEGKWIFLKR